MKSRTSTIRGLALLTAAGILSLSGCMQFAPGAALQPQPVFRGQSDMLDQRAVLEGPVAAPIADIQPGDPVRRTSVHQLPAPGRIPDIADSAAGPSPHALPITLDLVFRLAQDQNSKVAMAREKLEEALARQDLASRCLPDLYLGPAFYRHEGGIQDFNGNLIISSFGSLFAGMELRGQLDMQERGAKKVQAELKVWESMGEVSRLTSEKLLEASSTYMDMLAAMSSGAVAVELEKKLESLLKQAKNWAGVEPGANVEAARIEAAIQGHRQAARQMGGNARAAAAKLGFLLSLDPANELIPLDRRLVPLTLVEENAPLPALIDEAMSGGPGIREMEGMLNTIEEADRKSKGCGRFIPVMQMNVAEGSFGAGPGVSSAWANRFDMALQMRWNLTALTTAHDQRRLANSRAQQSQIGYQELRSRLAAGVQEALTTSASRKEEIKLGESQIAYADKAYELSRYRFAENVKGATPSEVLASIRALAEAHFKHLDAVREYNQAQLRLFVMTGRVDPATPGPGPGDMETVPVLPAPRTLPTK